MLYTHLENPSNNNNRNYGAFVAVLYTRKGRRPDGGTQTENDFNDIGLCATGFLLASFLCFFIISIFPNSTRVTHIPEHLPEKFTRFPVNDI